MPKQYTLVGEQVIDVPSTCNICQKDVSEDPAYFHAGYCPICQGETRHTIPFRGAPWICREPHVNDATACAACGKEISAVATVCSYKGPRKLICQDCDPLK